MAWRFKPLKLVGHVRDAPASTSIIMQHARVLSLSNGFHTSQSDTTPVTQIQKLSPSFRRTRQSLRRFSKPNENVVMPEYDREEELDFEQNSLDSSFAARRLAYENSDVSSRKSGTSLRSSLDDDEYRWSSLKIPSFPNRAMFTFADRVRGWPANDVCVNFCDLVLPLLNAQRDLIPRFVRLDDLERVFRRKKARKFFQQIQEKDPEVTEDVIIHVHSSEAFHNTKGNAIKVVTGTLVQSAIDGQTLYESASVMNTTVSQGAFVSGIEGLAAAIAGNAQRATLVSENKLALAQMTGAHPVTAKKLQRLVPVTQFLLNQLRGVELMQITREDPGNKRVRSLCNEICEKTASTERNKVCRFVGGQEYQDTIMRTHEATTRRDNLVKAERLKADTSKDDARHAAWRLEAREFLMIETQGRKSPKPKFFPKRVRKAKTSDAKESDVKKPDAKEPDAKEPGAKEPDAKEPDAKEPDAKEPDAKEPDAKEPDAKEPDAKELDAKEPDTKEPDVKNSDAKEPDAKKAAAEELENPAVPVVINRKNRKARKAAARLRRQQQQQTIDTGINCEQPGVDVSAPVAAL